MAEKYNASREMIDRRDKRIGALEAACVEVADRIALIPASTADEWDALVSAAMRLHAAVNAGQ